MIPNGMIREYFTKKVMGVLSPGGGESAETSTWVHRRRVSQRERTANTSAEWDSSCYFFCGRGRKGRMWVEPCGEV